ASVAASASKWSEGRAAAGTVTTEGMTEGMAEGGAGAGFSCAEAPCSERVSVRPTRRNRRQRRKFIGSSDPEWPLRAPCECSLAIRQLYAGSSVSLTALLESPAFPPCYSSGPL